VNALGIGAQGSGGLSTVLDVKVLTYPTHAANLPIAMIPELRSDAARALRC
jgi:fumarate hydratase class I